MSYRNYLSDREFYEKNKAYFREHPPKDFAPSDANVTVRTTEGCPHCGRVGEYKHLHEIWCIQCLYCESIWKWEP